MPRPPERLLLCEWGKQTSETADPPAINVKFKEGKKTQNKWAHMWLFPYAHCPEHLLIEIYKKFVDNNIPGI